MGKYVQENEYSSEDDEEVYPKCYSCQKKSVSINNLKECIYCEIYNDELLPRIQDLPLSELKNIKIIFF